MSRSVDVWRALTAAALLIAGGGASRVYADVAACKANFAEQNFTVERTNVRINANSGRVNGGTRFPGAESVQVIIEGKNPFKYGYRVDIATAPLGEAIAGRFFRLIPGLAPMNSFPLPALPPGAANAACANDPEKSLLSALVAAHASAKAARTPLQAALNPRADVYKRYEKFVLDTNVEVLAGAAVCDEAEALSTDLAQLVDLGETPKLLQAYSDALGKLRTEREAFRKATEACRAEQSTVTSESDTMLGELASLQTQVKELQDEKSSFEAMKTLVTNVLAEQNPFVRAYFPPTAGEATGVTVHVTRTNLRQVNGKEERTATVFLQVGESTVSVSAGLGFTTAFERRIGRVSAMVPPATGTVEVLGNRFNYLENSGNRGIAMMMLNERIPRPLRVNRAWWPDVISTGVGFRPDGGTTVQTEWIPGAIGWNMGSKHVLLTLGLHLSRGDCLPDPADTLKKLQCAERQQSFKIGDAIPSGLSDPLPVQRVWSRGLLFGVSFRTE